MKDTIVFDIDGTIADICHRLHYISSIKKDWASFYEACDKDEPIPEMLMLAKLLRAPGYRIVFVTGRPEKVRDKTLSWLIDQGIVVNSTDLYMRKDKDYRPDYEIKEELVDPFVDKILMVFEDRSSVVKMWRELGIKTLQVDKGDF